MKYFLLPFTTCLTLFIQSGAIASDTAFPAVKCYIFQGEQLSIENTCITEGETGPDGGFMTLTWENGATTLRSFGKQPQGRETCPNLEDNIDGFCGRPYLRHLTTFQPVLGKAADQLQKEGNAIQCIQLQKKSICWKP
jgi:hypothetical protein